MKKVAGTLLFILSCQCLLAQQDLGIRNSNYAGIQGALLNPSSIAVGSLTIKGTTKPAEIPFTFTPTGGSGTFKGQFTIKREDFNLGKPGGSVGSVVTINLDVPVKK